MQHNNILQISQKLVDDSTYPPTLETIIAQEKLDDQIGRAIQTGIKKYRHFYYESNTIFNQISRTQRLK